MARLAWLALWTGHSVALQAQTPPLSSPIPKKPALRFIDWNESTNRQFVVDREEGQYLGHPSTVLLDDGCTLLCVYPKGHGRGEIVLKRSSDGGLTWSPRLPTPASWLTSKETPTLHAVVAPDGRKRLLLFSGLYPARMSQSEDQGETWSELTPVGDWGGIVVMSSLISLRTGPGHYLAMFHDDGRYFHAENRQAQPIEFRVLKTVSTDGGLSWSTPVAVLASSQIHPCEPGLIRSPDGRSLACLLRENRRTAPSQVIFSQDEGQTWSAPRTLPPELCGDRHVGRYAPDGRLLISFRAVSPQGMSSPYDGDWVAWVGNYDNLEDGTPGQYLVRLKDNLKDRDCAYPGVEVLPDGTFVVTTYGHWEAAAAPFILSVRLQLAELETD